MRQGCDRVDIGLERIVTRSECDCNLCCGKEDPGNQKAI